MEYIDELENLLVHYPSLEACRGDILKAYEVLSECFARDGFVFTTGNGGSASDADHIVGELLKGFKLRRPLCEAEKVRLLGQGQPEGAMLSSRLQRGFRAMSLMSQTAIYTAAGNDLGGDMGPAQQLNSLGRPGDVLFGISTSGNAMNIALAVQVARMKGMKTIGLTGCKGGRLAEMADVCIKVPENETYRIQELHLPVYHALCSMLEVTFFKE